MSYINDVIAGGIDPLQDVDREFDAAFRSVRQGFRVLDRDEVGDLIIDRNSIGDMHGWILWNQIPNARACPAWAQLWPTKVATPPQTGTGDQFFPFNVVPISFQMDFDARWGAKSPAMGRFSPGSGRPIWNLPARGTVGIMVSTTNEYDPNELFMPTDPRMVAPNNRGDGAMGSIVCDLADDGSYDQTRIARLQTMMRVVPLGTSMGIAGFVRDPFAARDDGANLGVIAWNHALTGTEGALGRGAVFDQASGVDDPPPMPPTPPPVVTGPLPQPPPPPSPPPGAPGSGK